MHAMMTLRMIVVTIIMFMIGGHVIAINNKASRTKITKAGKQTTGSGSTITAATVTLLGSVPANECAQFPQKLPRSRPIRFDNTEPVDFSKGHPKRLTFNIEQSSPLTINFTQAMRFPVARKLIFNHSNILQTACSNESAFFMTLPCARPGRYDLLLVPPRQTAAATAIVNVQVNRFNRFANWSLLDIVNASSTVIRHHNRVQRRQMMVKWERSKVDTNTIHYCLVVSTQHNQRSLCSSLATSTVDAWPMASNSSTTSSWRRNGTIVQLMSQLGDTDPVVVCTGKKNRVQLQGMQPNRLYYIDVFGLHTRKDSLMFRMASTTVWFNRSQPEQLADDDLVTAKLSELGRQTVFSYRVPLPMLTSAVASPLVTKVQVLPCSISLLVKVFRKKVLLAHVEVERPMSLHIPGTWPNDRLVIKVSTADKYEFKRSQRFGIAATVGTRFTSIPEMPNNTSVEQIMSSCDSTMIAWFSSPDRRTVRYCVTVVEVTGKTYFNEELSTANVCDTIAAQATAHPNFRHESCFESTYPRGIVQSYQLNRQQAGSRYSVHVSVQVGNVSLPFDLLQLYDPNPYCYRTEDNDDGGDGGGGDVPAAEDNGAIDETAAKEWSDVALYRDDD